MYSDSFVFLLHLLLLPLYIFFLHCSLFIYATGSRDDIRVQFQQQHTFRHRGHLQSHITGARHSPPFVYRSQGGGSYFRLGFPSARATKATPGDAKRNIHTLSHPISFVMKRLVELRMTNGRTHDCQPRELAEKERVGGITRK